MKIMKRNIFGGQHLGYHLSLVPSNGIRPESNKICKHTCVNTNILLFFFS